jgi:hypothetical protein
MSSAISCQFLDIYLLSLAYHVSFLLYNLKAVYIEKTEIKSWNSSSR